MTIRLYTRCSETRKRSAVYIDDETYSAIVRSIRIFADNKAVLAYSGGRDLGLNEVHIESIRDSLIRRGKLPERSYIRQLKEA